MRHVIIRDDDTNALTPVECLERLYRPFLDRGLPVNLATIPRVRTDATNGNGAAEGFLFAKKASSPATMPIAGNGELVEYLHATPGFHVVQHGYNHSHNEFDSDNARDIEHRLDEGTQLLAAAGFRKPTTFVAPYDKLSSTSLRAVSKRFPVISTGWFELRRLPISWWPRYVLKKLTKQPHWRIENTLLLSHPGCLLSCNRPRETMLETIKSAVLGQPLTVLVTHWWEYFRNGTPDDGFISILHETAAWLENEPGVRVVSFDELVNSNRVGPDESARRQKPSVLPHPDPLPLGEGTASGRFGHVEWSSRRSSRWFSRVAGFVSPSPSAPGGRGPG